MLDKLRRIVQEVNASASLDEALAIIVRRVKAAMAVDVCSVYLTDSVTGQYVLMATDGLNPEAVGRVRLAAHEGLVGLVGERQEPVNLPQAADHPRYRYFPETGEERYHSFLGVPIINYRRVQGVLVAQQREPRLFNEDELAFFVTIAAQLAGAITIASASGGISRLLNGHTVGSAYLQGVRGAPGVAIGTIVVPYPLANLEAVPNREARDPEAEETAFCNAVTAVQEEMRASGERMAVVLPAEERALFDVYVMLLGSDTLVADTVQRIRSGMWAPAALRDTIREHARVFEQMEDSYLQARSEDIRDIGRRLLIRLQSEEREPREYPEDCVLLSDEVSVAQIAEVPVGRLAGIVCMRGSALSHTAVLARALDVPAVMGLGDLPIGRLDGCRIVVDGSQGRIYVQPTGAVLTEFRRLVGEEVRMSAGLKELQELPAETTDGHRVPLYVNTGLLSDISPARDSGAEGVGLYRTEFGFLVRQSFPGEDEQCQIYREVLKSFAPNPVTMRTLDVGGDKSLPYFAIKEDNPFLGWRGLRITLDHPEIFLTQLRAMLRANRGFGNLQVLLPMVSRLEEVDEALRLLDRARLELTEEGGDVPRPQVGAMVEVPATVYQAAALAQRVDFLSVGTNDLTQYLLAVDRNNARVAGLYDCLHPAVIRALREVVTGAHRWQKPVSVCGEMAGDPAASILLMGLGVDSLSMNASSLPRVKWTIRSLSLRHAQAIALQALEQEDPAAIRALLYRTLESVGLGGLARSGV